jgi:hypothetical protein
VEPRNQYLAAQMKAGVFMDVLTLGEVDSFHWP